MANSTSTNPVVNQTVRYGQFKSPNELERTVVQQFASDSRGWHIAIISVDREQPTEIDPRAYVLPVVGWGTVLAGRDDDGEPYTQVEAMFEEPGVPGSTIHQTGYRELWDESRISYKLLPPGTVTTSYTFSDGRTRTFTCQACEHESEGR